MEVLVQHLRQYSCLHKNHNLLGICHRFSLYSPQRNCVLPPSRTNYYQQCPHRYRSRDRHNGGRWFCSFEIQQSLCALHHGLQTKFKPVVFNFLNVALNVGNRIQKKRTCDKSMNLLDQLLPLFSLETVVPFGKTSFAGSILYQEKSYWHFVMFSSDKLKQFSIEFSIWSRFKTKTYQFLMFTLVV